MTVLDVRQIELRHRYVFVLLDCVVGARPDIDNLVFGVAIYRNVILSVRKHSNHIKRALDHDDDASIIRYVCT